MDKNSPIKNGIIIGSIILVFVGAYYLLNKFSDDSFIEDVEYLVDYEVNQYIPTYVSDEDMARIYLNDYIHTMYYDAEGAYNLLAEEYRNKKFGSLEVYKNYVSTMNFPTYNLTKYYKKETKGFIIFGVYDQNGNFFGFKTQGVMQYKVYLDEETVEIW